MRLEVDTLDDTIRIALSRRNLRSMLAKLDGYPPRSALRIESDPGVFDGWTLVFTGESDEIHYVNRPSPPGIMHEETENQLNEP